MKILKHLMLAVILTAILPVVAAAKSSVMPKGYLFGFVGNFTDSVVYFTDIQEVDSIVYDKRSRFLIGRDIYANQLRNYFTEELKMPHRTCIVSFGLTRKAAEKKLMKMRKLYTGKNAGKYEIRQLNENQFRFTTAHTYETEQPPMTKAEIKAAKEQKKQDEQKAKEKAKEAKAKAKEAKSKAKEARRQAKNAKKGTAPKK